MTKKRSVFFWLETGIFLLLVLWAGCLVAMVCIHGGPLWRDEINTVWMANRSSLAELWRWMEFDSFPILWFGVVRAWINLGMGDTDQGLRVLGALMGLGQLLVMWHVARIQSRRLPLLFFALYALNPVMFFWATSLRAYGLGIVTLLLMFAAVWAYVDRPNCRRWMWALIASLVAVQSLYYNSIVLAAMIFAGIGSFLFSRRRRQILPLLLIGVISAASVLPYVLGPMAHARTWNEMAQEGQTTVVHLLQKCGLVMGNTISLVQWTWLLLGCLIYLGLVIEFWRWHSSRRRCRAIFLIILLPALWVMHIRFLLLLGYTANPWYFVTLLAVTALAIDRGAEMLIRRHPFARGAGLLVVILLLCSTIRSNWVEAHVRHTTMDVVANILTQKAVPEDFIVISPYWLGVSFHRYYHGPTASSTIPPLTDHNIHRMDLVKQQTNDPNAIQPLLDQIQRTLQSGHRVWYVGEPEFFKKNQSAALSLTAMDAGQRVYFWKLQVGDVLEKNAISMEQVPYSMAQPVRASQAAPLFLFTSPGRNGK